MASGFEGRGDDVAGFFGANEQIMLRDDCGLREESLGEGLGDISRWQEDVAVLRCEAGLFDGFRGCRTYGSDTFWMESNALRAGTFGERIGCVCAGKDEPFEVCGGTAELCDCEVERGEGCWADDLYGRDEDRLGTERFKLCG